MKQYQLFQTDFGAPPPPPPPSMSTPPPPPPSGGMNNGVSGSASTNAIIALVAGIVAWIFCWGIGGVVAWIMGKGELSKIDRGESPEAGRSLAKIGMWLGIVNVILSVLFIIGYVFILVIALVAGN